MGWGCLAYSDTGPPGPALVFLHGTGCDSRDWKPVIEALPPGLRVITMDFRTHGRSDIPIKSFVMDDLAADVIALADSLSLKEMILVGHSLGGMTAIRAARLCRRVSGIVLIEGWTSLGATAAFRSGHMYGQLSSSRVARIGREHLRVRTRVGPRKWRRFWRSVQEFDGSRILAELRIPVFEVYGSIGRRSGTRKALGVPDGPHIRWFWIKDAGHYALYEKPQAIAAICARAIASVPAI